MLPIRATKRERGDGDLSDGSECEEFHSEMMRIHFAVEVMFTEVQGAFQIKFDYVRWHVIFSEKGLGEKAINFVIILIHTGTGSESSAPFVSRCLSWCWVLDVLI